MIEAEKILNALREVKFPGIDRDIVSLGYVKDITEEEGRAIVTVEMSTSLPDAGAFVEEGVRGALDRLEVPHEVRMRVRSPQAHPAAQAQNARLLETVPIKIAVASGKGGVGKSTVAINLALAIARMNVNVGLLDCDVYGPSIPLMMGLESEQPLVRADRLMPLERYGIRSFSIGYLVDRDTPVIWRGPMVGKALDQMMTDVDWTGTEVMIMDLPPGTGDVQISIAQKTALTGAVIVTTPQDVALIDAGKGIAMFDKVQIPILGVVENMSYFLCPHCGERTDIFRAGGGRLKAERHGVPLLAEIPIDARIPVGGDLGRPIMEEAPESEAGLAFIEAAAAIMRAVRAGS
jgi:ATP-binding protein involved in chromosome partitioning